MYEIKTLKDHAALVDRMATTVGVDLEEAAFRGTMDFDEIADAVLRCTGCSKPDDCGQWMAQTPQADATPDYCRNAEMLARLRA
ncbi:MAG: DUF6455 family protein [Rhodobacteraceae bacterium]|nr:DUF6455 family protein [Paracoccaceae bacterium]